MREPQGLRAEKKVERLNSSGGSPSPGPSMAVLQLPTGLPMGRRDAAFHALCPGDRCDDVVHLVYERFSVNGKQNRFVHALTYV